MGVIAIYIEDWFWALLYRCANQDNFVTVMLYQVLLKKSYTSRAQKLEKVIIIISKAFRSYKLSVGGGLEDGRPLPWKEVAANKPCTLCNSINFKIVKLKIKISSTSNLYNYTTFNKFKAKVSKVWQLQTTTSKIKSK